MLGDGHRREKVVVVDQDRILFIITRVQNNRPRTMGRVILENGASFNLKNKTVKGQRVSLFLWTEEWEFRWRLQCEVEAVVSWIRSANPEEVIALHHLAAQLAGMEIIYFDPFLACVAEQQIVEALWRLGLVQLQGVTAMLRPDLERMAA